MAAIEGQGANAEQVRYWNAVAGPNWVAYQRVIDAQIRVLGTLAMDRVGIRVRERVLDVGCGCGDTTFALARRVGPTGSVLGLDISDPMLDVARQAAFTERMTNVRFQNADAQTCAFARGDFDVVYSRFGIMFFADPLAAFRNLSAALRSGGRLAFVCWQRMEDNPWMFVPMSAAAGHVALPPPNPDAPGPFSLADPGKLRRILADAGFVDVGLEDHAEILTVGGGADLEGTIAFLLKIGPAASALREANDPKLTERVAAAVREAIRPYSSPEGVRLGSATWIVTARTSDGSPT
jgi:SAM-dependent methyltransferase